MYIVTNTTIFLIVHLLLLRYNYMFRPSMLGIFRLYTKHLTISYIYMWVGSLQFVGWGGCEISFCVCRRGVNRVCLGCVLKYRLCLLIAMSISRLHFWCLSSILEKLYFHGLRLNCYGLVSTVFLHILDYLFTISTSLYYMHWMLCTIIIIYDLLLRSDQPIIQCSWMGGWLLTTIVGGNYSRGLPWVFSYAETEDCWGHVSTCEGVVYPK